LLPEKRTYPEKKSLQTFPVGAQTEKNYKQPKEKGGKQPEGRKLTIKTRDSVVKRTNEAKNGKRRPKTKKLGQRVKAVKGQTEQVGAKMTALV